MRTHDDVKRNDERLSEHDWHDLLNVPNAYVEESTKSLQCISNLSGYGRTTSSKLLLQNIKWSYFRRTRSSSLFRRIGWMQTKASFGKSGSTKFHSNELSSQLRQSWQHLMRLRRRRFVLHAWHWTQENESCCESRRSRNTLHGPMYRFARRRRRFLYARYEEILKSGDCTQRSRTDGLHLKTPIFLHCTDSF